MKAQVYFDDGWTARTRYGKLGFECGGDTRQDALDELARIVKATTGIVAEFEVEEVTVPILPLSVFTQQLRLF